MKIIILNTPKEKPIFTNKDFYISSNDVKIDKNSSNYSFFGNIAVLLKFFSTVGISDDTVGVIWNDMTFSFLKNDMEPMYLDFKLPESVDFVVPKFEKKYDENKNLLNIKGDCLQCLFKYLTKGVKMSKEDSVRLIEILKSLLKSIETRFSRKQINYFWISNDILPTQNFITSKQKFYECMYWFRDIFATTINSTAYKDICNWKKLSKNNKNLAELLFKKLLIIFLVEKRVVFAK